MAVSAARGMASHGPPVAKMPGSLKGYKGFHLPFPSANLEKATPPPPAICASYSGTVFCHFMTKFLFLMTS
jgi:hypothetical protein